MLSLIDSPTDWSDRWIELSCLNFCNAKGKIFLKFFIIQYPIFFFHSSFVDLI